MAQQFHNGGHHGANYAGSVTVSIRDSKRYAVINEPGMGKHKRSRGNYRSKVKPIFFTDQQKECFKMYNWIRKRFTQVV